MARTDRRRNDELILRAAAQLLGVDGSASMQAVADAAGVSRVSVYRRYPDRQALVSALRAAVDAELDQVLDQVLDGSLDQEPAWTGGTRPLAELTISLASVAARYPISLLRHSPGPGVSPPADVRIAAVLRAGQRAGALRSDLSADTLNAVLFGVLSAVLDSARRSRPDDLPDGAAVARTVLDLLLPGITTTTTTDVLDRPHSG